MWKKIFCYFKHLMRNCILSNFLSSRLLWVILWGTPSTTSCILLKKLPWILHILLLMPFFSKHLHIQYFFLLITTKISKYLNNGQLKNSAVFSSESSYFIYKVSISEAQEGHGWTTSLKELGVFMERHKEIQVSCMYFVNNTHLIKKI